MFSRTNQAARRGESFSVIGPDVVVTGDISTSESLQVSGRIDGDVRCAGLHLAAGGAIAGNVVAEEARLAGRVDGTLSANLVTIEASARVTGEVAYTILSIASGARVDGCFAHRAEPGEDAEAAGEVSFNEIFPHEDTAGATR